MARRIEPVGTDDDLDDEDEEDLVMQEDNDFELEFEADVGDAPITVRPRRPGAWRLIEEASERRQLKRALEDFDDYVV